MILYDQIGNGKSTNLREKLDDEEFWVEDLFLDQQGKGYDLLGQSWGGMMGATFIPRRPKGLRKAILSNSPAITDLWLKAANEYM